MRVIYFLCVLLISALVFLGISLGRFHRGIEDLCKQLRGFQGGSDNQRLSLPSPHRHLETLAEEINGLLEEKQRSEIEHARQEQSLRQQISNISHDLRTPLTSILGYVQLLEDSRTTEEERRKYLAVIESRSKNLQALITSFYDLSRLEAREYPLHLELVELYPLLAELIASFYEDFTTRGFVVSLELSEGVTPIPGDRHAILRVLTNLLQNVQKHGIGQMKISLFETERQVVTIVSNAVSRMTEEDALHVFDRFFTADRMRTGQNTGLGLAIVKNLVEQMGHKVSASVKDGIFAVRIDWNKRIS